MVVDKCSSLLALVLSSNIIQEELTAALDYFPMDPFSFQEEEEVLAADSSTCSNPYPLESDEPGTLGIHPLEALNQCVESMSSTVQSETKITRLGVGRTRNSNRTGPRRHKANARERQRMHGLNDALDLLRRRAPIISGTQKLSKIETLRLARNYIELLDRVLTDKQPELLNNSSSNAETSNLLTRGLSQTTSNVIESLLGVHPRSCFNFPPQQANKSYNNEETTHSGGLQPRSRLQGGDFQLNDLLSNLVSHNRVQSAPSDSESLHLLSEQDQPHTSNSVDGENNIWNIEDEWDSELIQFDEHSICF